MEGLRQPVGDEPPEVYWRRRVILLSGLVLFLLVVYFLVTSPSGADDGSTPGATVTPTPGTPGDPSVPRACGPDDIHFTTVANPRNFPSGAIPNFDVDIEHIGETPCLLSTASDGTELLIMSGNDRIWSSTDCPAESPIDEREFLLAPQDTERIQVPWPRTRSREGCIPESAIPRPGTYLATLTIQGIPSDTARFTLSE